MFALVGQWKASGQTKQTFCAGQAINIHTFSYWATKYNQSQLSSPGGFAPIDLANPAEAGHLSIHYPNGVRISLNGAPLSLISHLIRIA